MNPCDLTEEKNRIEGGTLYLVATPIGNLADLGERAQKALCEVDFIAAEDTRVTAKILQHLGVQKELFSYHEHNKKSAGSAIAARLKNGESCALVTDAGTPAISDPGQDIVRICIEQGLPVTAIPGPCALIDALILSGMDTGRFVFEGFLDQKGSAKVEHLRDLANEKRTLIFYETPHDLIATLSQMAEIFGNRQIALCRELTKRNEEILRCDIQTALAHYGKVSPRGEYVLVLEGKQEEVAFWAEMSVQAHVEFYIQNGLSKMDATKAAARDRGVSKNEIYKALLQA